MQYNNNILQQPFGMYPPNGYGQSGYYSPTYGDNVANAQVQTPKNTQIQSGGIVIVKSEEEAKNYPVAPGYSTLFVDEGLTHIYAKTKGFSQLEKPQFEKFKLVKELTADEIEQQATMDASRFATKGELLAIANELNAIKSKIGVNAEVVADE